jgi:hypothetical protein
MRTQKKTNGRIGKLPRQTRAAKEAASILHDEVNGYGRNGGSLFTMASLFTGIGGFDLGFEAAGFKTTFQCEINKYCLSVLEKHWPTIPKATNIKELKYETTPPSDVWTAGFPCQDVSLARMDPKAGLRGRALGSFMSLLASLEKDAPELFYSKTFTACLVPTKDATSRTSYERWPTSGILSDGVCLTATASESPNHAKESTLLGVIEMSTVPDRYFLGPSVGARKPHDVYEGRTR